MTEQEITEKQILDRLEDKIPKCPDCGHILDKIQTEQSVYQEFTPIWDGEKVVLTASTDVTAPTDIRYRCGYCDSLNIDEMIGMLPKGVEIANT